MESIKKSKEFEIFKKRNGRYGVQNPKGKWINGEEKTKILLAEKLIKISAPAPKKEEAPAEEAEAPAAE